MRRAAALALLVFLAAAPGAAAAPTFTNPHGTIVVHPRERFDVVFEATPGTGYSWVVARRPDASIVRYVKSVVLDGGRAPGAPAQQHLVFRSKAKGTTSMKLAYVGPGRDHPVAKRRTLTVKVR